MSATDPRVGDVTYLEPVTPGAPTVAYSRPRVRVVAIEYPLMTVELEDGTRVTTSHRNLFRRSAAARATDATPRARTLPGAAPRIDPRHGDELPLFDLDPAEGAGS